MKILKALCGASFLYVLLFAGGTQFSSCVKETVYDTVIVRDTITNTIRDTITKIDSSTCGCYDLKDGLVAYYNFKGGSLKDSSGMNNHIIDNNATPTTDRFGKANGAYLFNGTSNYMRIANSTSLNPAGGTMTIEVIFKPNGFYTGACKGNALVQKGDGDYEKGHYAVRYATFDDCSAPLDVNKMRLGSGYGNRGGATEAANVKIDTVPVTLNRWYNAVFTFEFGVAKAYLDGELKNVNYLPWSFTSNTYDVYLGRLANAQYPYWFNGVLDEVRIYNKALCADAVKQLYNTKE